MIMTRLNKGDDCMTTRISATLAKKKLQFLWTASAVMLGALLLLATASGVQAADLLHNSTDTGSGTSKWPNGWGVAGGKYGQFTCETCHEPNNKANIKNIRTVISTPSGENWPSGSPQVQVVLKNVTSMGDDSAARTSSNRICEVCHSQNRFHNYSTTSNLSHGGGFGHPNPKAVCTSCHSHNTGFKAACGGCHGNPPTTAVLGGDTGLIGTPRASNALQPSQAGAHATHVQTRSMVCDTCHYISNGGIPMPNQSGTIQIGFFGFGGKVTSGTYVPYTSASRGYPFSSGTPNTTIAAAATAYADANKCLNVYCHGGGSAANGKAPLTGGLNTTPNWDGVNQNACGNCHGTTAANPPTMGSHVMHAGSATGYSYVCDTCHPAIDVSHVQGSVRWQFSATDQRVAGAKYQASGSPTAENIGATGDLAPSSTYGTCSTVYCHFDRTPQWGGSLAGDCTGCHGNDEFSADPMVKNAHKAHVYNRSAKFDHFDFKCNECHNSTVDATNRSIINKGLHANSTKDIVWGPLAKINGGGAQSYATNGCSTIYCHSDGNGNYKPPVQTWNQVADGSEGTVSCDYCHGGLATDATVMTDERHNNHVKQSPAGGILHTAIACDKCHDATVGPDGASIDASAGTHLNGVRNINFAKFANRSGSWVGGATRRCDNTYCHGRNNPTWGTTSINQCGSCHRANNTTSSGLSTAHIKHYNSSTTPLWNTNEGWTNVNKSVTNNVFMCGTCHSVDPNTQHVNGPPLPNGAAAEVVINLPFAVPPGAERSNTVTRGTTVVADGSNYFYSRETSCDTYCHSNGRGGPPVNTMTWDTSTTSCGNCHNKAGDANPTWSGAHTKHLTSPVSTAATCNACHAATASGNNALISGRRDRHPNGFRNVTSGGLAGGMRWNGTNCTNAYCHFNSPTPDWTGKLATRCSSCHGSTAASGIPMTRNAHKAHVANTSQKFNNFNFGCRECHNTVVYDNNTSILSTTLHVNGTQNVAWGPLSTGGGAYNAGACSTIYCHSNGAGTYKPPTNWRTVADGTEGTASCDYCHKGVAGDFKIMSSARHYNHVVQSPAVGVRHVAIGCDKCHDLTVGPDGKSIDSTSSKHLSRTVDISFYKFSNRSGAWQSSNKQCNVTYCHGGANPRWTTTTINNCGSCHAASASTTRALSTTHGKHYNSTTNISKTVGWDNSNVSTATNHIFRCGVCHNVYPETDHLNGPVTQNGAAAQIVFNLPAVPAGASRPNTYAYGTGQNTDGGGYIYSSGTTCDVYCHSDGNGGPSKQVFSWTATTFSCGYCHNNQGDSDPAPTWSTPHTKHIRGYAEGGNPNFGCQDCHQQTTTTGTTIASRIYHINGARNVAFDTWAGGSWSGTACTNVYCHSDGKATPTYALNQTWTTIAPNCLGCHGNGISTGGNNSQLSGKHAKHLSTANLKCASCHYKTVSKNDNITLKQYSGVRYHITKTRDVTLDPAFGGTWNGTSCSSVYCHSSGAYPTPTYANPNWATTTTTCTSCHGGDASQGTKMATNRHGTHMDNLASLGVNFACNTCHAATVSDNTTISNYANHVNTQRDVSFVGIYGGSISGTSPAVTCSNTSCHAARNPVWNGAVSSGHTCTKCHGAAGVSSPTEAQMAPGNGRDLGGPDMTSPTSDIQVGAHQQHLGGLGSTSIAKVRCSECHTVPGTITANNHLTRSSAEVTFANSSAARKNGATPSFTASAGSVAGQCSNVYCHGAAMPKGDTSGTNRIVGASSIFWNQTSYRSRTATPTNADCSTCHGNPPTAGLAAGAHADYVGQPTTSCTGCHTHFNGNGTLSDPSLHIDGKVDASGSNCDSCHDYDVVGAAYAGGVWSGGTWGKNSKDGLTPNQGWGAHAKHINYIKTRIGISTPLSSTGQAFGSGEPANVCGSCHTNNAANHTIVGSTVRSINFGDSTFMIGGPTGTSMLFGSTNPAYNGVSGTPSANTPKTCSNISCHYFTTSIW